MKYEFCAQTHTGLVRENNEDALAFDRDTNVVVLADGMGGYNAGEVASTMATSVIRKEMARWLKASGSPANHVDVRHALHTCVQQANLAILNAGRANALYAGMGTTIVAAVFQGDRLTVGHVGDSRCYRLRGTQLQQITRDHSWLQAQMDAGRMTPQEAAVSQHRNLVTRALGIEAEVRLEINELQVEPGDLFILCSDGLTDMVSDEDLAEMAHAPIPLQEKAKLMVDTANNQGGRDNVSVLLVQASADGNNRRSLVSGWIKSKTGN